MFPEQISNVAFWKKILTKCLVLSVSLCESPRFYESSYRFTQNVVNEEDRGLKSGP